MENLELNKQEKVELEKRGFFVKEILTYYMLLKILLRIPWIFIVIIIPIYIILFSIISFLWYEEMQVSQIIWSTTEITLGITSTVYLLILLSYTFLWKLFFTQDKVYAYTKKFWSIKQIWLFNKTLFLSNIFLQKDDYALYIPFITMIVFTLPFLFLYNKFQDIIILFYSSILFLPTLPYILRQLVEHFHPLYAFGNIWEKIQKLTPRIEEQSQKIQSEFQSDMNFSVLSNWFDALSTTFTDIVSLVIKLEKVEARANKGNLFDSEKYINSLRSDIITPLNSLRTFLEKQKTELIQSQKELTRVRVWGKEGTENMELQSKRSESLIQELTENIEKLDVMIGKMGK